MIDDDSEKRRRRRKRKRGGGESIILLLTEPTIKFGSKPSFESVDVEIRMECFYENGR